MVSSPSRKLVIFNAAKFTATKWDTAEQKARFANHFARFVASGFKKTLFYDWFYRRLSVTFGHIAHFNRDGFFEGFFTSTERKVNFLQWTITPRDCYGDSPEHTYIDVERAIVSWLNDSGYVAYWMKQRDEEVKNSELSVLAQLKAKYPEA